MIGFRAACQLEFIDPGRPAGVMRAKPWVDHRSPERATSFRRALEQVHALARALVRSVVASMSEPWHAIRSQLADLDAPVVAGVARPVG